LSLHVDNTFADRKPSNHRYSNRNRVPLTTRNDMLKTFSNSKYRTTDHVAVTHKTALRWTCWKI